MDIIVKSFNRPYYLDRCIQSIKKHVLNTNYLITVLDDGTPQKYLDKLMKMHPEIRILKSKSYSSKVDFINGELHAFPNEIPIDLWLASAQKCSDYFVLLEDDIWFTKPIQLLNVTQSLQTENVKMLKLFWLSNSNLISNRSLKKSKYFVFHKPQVFTRSRFLYQVIFNLDRFKIRKLLTIFGLFSLKKQLQYYTVYSVAGVIFEKNFFLKLWENHNNVIDENLQIKNALDFINTNSGCNFGHFNLEILQTSFLSAATNSHKNFKNVNLDMFEFNKIINESWFRNEFNVMENFPNDFNSNYIEKILNSDKIPNINANEWLKWVNSFKNQYINIGCKIT